MNLRIILTSILILTSLSVSATIEYYSCEEKRKVFDVEWYWKFDLEAINKASPDSATKSRLRTSAFKPLYVSIIQISDDWIKAKSGNYPYSDYYISRKGKESYILDYIEKRSIGLCKKGIPNEDLSVFFKTIYEIKKEKEDAEAEILANQPPVKNWGN